MEPIKLTYFNIMGLGETVRFMLSYLGKPFKDYRIDDFETWMREFKPKMPFGKLPLLEMGDKKLHQTVAICRYLGKQAKLAGDDDWEALQIDIFIDTLSDFRFDIWKFFYNRDLENKEKVRKPLFEVTVPYYLKKIDDTIEKNGGYVANGKLSWGDIYFVAILGYFSFMIELDIVSKYPNIKSLQEKVHSLHGIKGWVENRPKTNW